MQAGRFERALATLLGGLLLTTAVQADGARLHAPGPMVPSGNQSAGRILLSTGDFDGDREDEFALAYHGALTAGFVWDDDAHRWILELAGPEGESTLEANVVVSAVGQQIGVVREQPAIPGRDLGTTLDSRLQDVAAEALGEAPRLVALGGHGVHEAVERHQARVAMRLRTP